MKFIVLALALVVSSAASAESAVERECSSGKCTCSYIASTCKSWNRSHGGDLAICDSYRQTCLTELRTARKAGHLTEGTLEPERLARQAGAFARFADWLEERGDRAVPHGGFHGGHK